MARGRIVEERVVERRGFGFGSPVAGVLLLTLLLVLLLVLVF